LGVELTALRKAPYLHLRGLLLMGGEGKGKGREGKGREERA